jgi:hypothetical protein
VRMLAARGGLGPAGRRLSSRACAPT